MRKTFEQQFMEDIFDVINNNKEYITQEQFLEKYEDYEVEIDYATNIIEVRNPYERTQFKLEITQVLYDKE